MRRIKRFITRLIEDACVWILGKLNITRLKELTIDDRRIVIGISKFIPDDKKWHHVMATVYFWINIKSKKRRKSHYDELAVYIDGKKRMKRRLK